MKVPQNIQDVMKNWESYTLLADSFYHQQQYKQASKVFSKSVEIIEPWLDKDEKELNKVMHLFVLSCHNTAHALNQLGKNKEAEYYYSHAHFRLLSLISRPKRSSRIMENAVYELKTTLKQLKYFLLSMNKDQLAGNIHEESVRVLRKSYVDYVEDVFTV
ncbi:tetratricopeptide repeat protein (plasmid) [Bermanella sp. WJH001]|uniref:tetratricopeptide repeat protein n=1 Tax=Bermanella sp. WJH001 TaxID=3048005 RepID=UPI0024BD66C5|nr:tetratricopeptide repeat protein [Bermanella sp. WJH001]MDJ1539503.1 tetratricopeptide repeat protein [Bermanella sp. WJH001]